MLNTDLSWGLLGGLMGIGGGVLFLRIFLRRAKQKKWLIPEIVEQLDRNTPENLEELMGEIHRGLRALARAPHPVAIERVRGLLHDLQRRLRLADIKVASRYEGKVLRLFEEAARLGITVSPQRGDWVDSVSRTSRAHSLE